MFGLADIQLDIFGFTVLSDNHTGVNSFARSDKQCTTLLCSEQTVSDGLAGFESDQGTLFSVLDISFVRSVVVKTCVQDTGTFGGSHEVSTETDQTTGRNLEFQTGGTVASGTHTLQGTFTFAHFLDDCTGELFRNIHVSQFHRL